MSEPAGDALNICGRCQGAGTIRECDGISEYLEDCPKCKPRAGSLQAQLRQLVVKWRASGLQAAKDGNRYAARAEHGHEAFAYGIEHACKDLARELEEILDA